MFPSFDLGPGQYWFAVVPNDPNDPGPFVQQQHVRPELCWKPDRATDQFFNSAFFGANYTNANTQGVFQTFSGGVDGTVVPEPSSLIMLGSGLVGVAGVIRRRLSR